MNVEERAEERLRCIGECEDMKLHTSGRSQSDKVAIGRINFTYTSAANRLWDNAPTDVQQAMTALQKARL